MNKFTATLASLSHTVSIECDTIEELVELHGRVTRAAYIEVPVTLSNGILAIEASDPVKPTAAAAGAQFGQTQSAVPLPPTHAPATAGAEVSTTAPAAQQATGTVPLPPAQTAVVAPPVAAAPVAQAAPVPPPGAAPSVDSKGLPWDHRIHSSKKSTIADGSWRKKTGVAPELVVQVEGELRGAMAAVAATPAASAVPLPPVAAVPLPPAATLEAQTTQPPAGPTYAQFMEELTAPMLTGKLTLADVGEACQMNGLANLPALIHRPDLVAAVRSAALARVRP
ncbi:MAG: RecT protein [Phage 65_10]|nr:MAG: RecT protein [Phage 65_10]